MNTLSAFHHWDVVALCAAMAVVFVFEMIGVFRSDYVTITYIVRSYMPMWLRAMIYGWMGYHFFLAPANLK